MNASRALRRIAAVTILIASAAPVAAYDPLTVPAGSASRSVLLTVHDAQRSRDIPLRVYLPPTHGAAPVVLFSHGLGGSRDGSTFLGKHWSTRGYVAVFLQHHGSDEAVWRNATALTRLKELRRAANARNFLLRTGDVSAVLTQLDRWNRSAEHVLHNCLDMTHVAMAGHSFGAVTTQAVSGESFGGALHFTDPRISAALVFSPSSPAIGDPKSAFGSVRIPWMLMTGTRDVAPIGDQTVAARLAVFPALPAGGKYELVLDGAEHSVFTDGRLPGERGNPNPNHHRAILALSTAFLDAYVRHDPAARTWLDGAGPSSVLQKADRWQRK